MVINKTIFKDNKGKKLKKIIETTIANYNTANNKEAKREAINEGISWIDKLI